MNPAPQNWKEARRLQAWRLKQKGWPQRQIADALGVSAAAVSQWMQRVRDGGPQALRHRPSPGAPRRLATAQLTRLPALLRRGPEAYGFHGQVWTRNRVAEVMRVEWGVLYHPPVSAGYSKPFVGVPKSRGAERSSATKPPWPSGATKRGPRSKGGGSPAPDDPLYR
jgi:transposase